jgi:hypothetical protein
MHLASLKSTEGGATPASEQSHTEANTPHQSAGEAPPRTFRITLRARRGRWNANTITAVAQNIGAFRHGDLGRLELPGVLKAEPRGRVEYETWPAQVGDGVSEFHVVMDLDSCCLGYGAFDSAMESARKMADALGADLIDAAGEPFTDESTAQEKARVEAVLAERRKAREIVRVLPDGTRATQGLISCQNVRRTKRGRYLGEEHFDVPALDYYPGAIHGYRLMLELLDALKAHTAWHTNHSDVENVLRAAAAAGRWNVSAPSEGNVANSVIDIAAHALDFFANHANYRGFIEQKIENEERSRDWSEDSKRREKAEFVARMRNAREFRAAVRAAVQQAVDSGQARKRRPRAGSAS